MGRAYQIFRASHAWIAIFLDNGTGVAKCKLESQSYSKVFKRYKNNEISNSIGFFLHSIF